MPKNKSNKRSNKSPRRLSVRGELRKSPDLDVIASTAIALAMAQAETEAREQAERRQEGLS